MQAFSLKYFFSFITVAAWCVTLNASGIKPIPSDTVYGFGIDISHHNPEPRWEELEVDFVILKATEGSTYLDPTFRERLDKCKKAGLPVGAYHYYRGTNPTIEEFENFRSAMGMETDIIPVVDIEKLTKDVSLEEFLFKLRNFISLLEDEYGTIPIIYAKENFYNRYLKGMLEEAWPGGNYHIWLGETDRPFGEYEIIPTLFQTKVKNLKGIEGTLDYNELHLPLDSILLK